MTDDRDKRRVVTPPKGVSQQIATIPTGEFDDNPISGVHGENILDAIERRGKTTLSKAQTTLETLERHDKDIGELKVTATRIEGLNQDQNRKLEDQDHKLDIHGAKLDTMLVLLDPNAPEKIKKIVHQEIQTTEYTTQKEEKKVKQHIQLTLVQGLLGLLTAAVSAGALGYLFHACRS